MNTSHLDQCCRILEEEMEFPTDKVAVLLVRIQRLAQSISQALTSRNNLDRIALSMTVQSFEHEIQQLRASIIQGSYSHGKAQPNTIIPLINMLTILAMV